jgi:hypothetical protein
MPVGTVGEVAEQPAMKTAISNAPDALRTADLWIALSLRLPRVPSM